MNVNNMNKELKEQARKIWETKAEDFTYEDLDSIIDKTYSLGLRKGVEMVEEKINKDIPQVYTTRDVAISEVPALEVIPFRYVLAVQGRVNTIIYQIKEELK